MAEMDSELKEVKEKLCTLAVPMGESKDEGQLNYTINVILLNRKFSRIKHVLNVCVRCVCVRERERERERDIILSQRDLAFQCKLSLE